MKIINLTTKDLKKIVNRVINESIYARRRAFQIETWIEDVLEYLDPLDYDDEFEYINEVVQALTDQLLSDDENLEYDSMEYHKMFDEVSRFIQKQLYYKIQDHYDTVRTDY
jgi:vacuolar-type H+-ATPase subunit E/Vma4